MFVVFQVAAKPNRISALAVTLRFDEKQIKTLLNSGNESRIDRVENPKRLCQRS
jgi:hypothetical protein